MYWLSPTREDRMNRMQACRLRIDSNKLKKKVNVDSSIRELVEVFVESKID